MKAVKYITIFLFVLFAVSAIVIPMQIHAATLGQEPYGMDSFDRNHQCRNLVRNSGFESILTGYTTTYGLYPGPYRSNGLIGVTTNAKSLQSNFLNFTGDGNFLGINSATNGNNDFICQDIRVERNRTYDFSVSSRTIWAPGKHAWYINGTAITGIITAPSGSWGTSTGTWNSGSATIARLCGRNMSKAYSGADFAVDTIVLRDSGRDGSCNNCESHVSQKCVENSVYWFNSCGRQQDLIQNCSGNQTCQSGACVNSCTPYSSQKCVGNSVYWFDSCGTQQELSQNCSANQTCQSGACQDQNQNVNCSSDCDCGANGFVDNTFCTGNDVYKNYKVNTCNNPGTSNSSCSSSLVPIFWYGCSSGQTCAGGYCFYN